MITSSRNGWELNQDFNEVATGVGASCAAFQAVHPMEVLILEATLIYSFSAIWFARSSSLRDQLGEPWRVQCGHGSSWHSDAGLRQDLPESTTVTLASPTGCKVGPIPRKTGAARTTREAA